MKTDAAVAPLSPPPATGLDRRVAAAVFVMSMASLLLELSLTRLFSVLLFYHFAFLAISIALLGLGVGGVFAHLRRQWLEQWSTRQLGVALAAANAVTVLVVLEIVLHVPVALEFTGSTFLRLTVIYLASAAPFFLTGLVFSVLFAREARRVFTLYAADLAGGAGACLAVVPALNWFGGPNAVIFAALLMAVAAVLWADSQRARRRTLALAVTLAVLIGANYSGRLVDVVYAKGQLRPYTEWARWNAISRVEVDNAGPAGRVIVIDADASTWLINADAKHLTPEQRDDFMKAVPSVVNAMRPHGEYAIIGPGGGVDVVRAIAAGSPSVTGIEINPLIATTVMRQRYADYAYHLYELPEVHIRVSDGRSWVRSAAQQFDVLQMTLVDTWASTAAGAFALSENNLYTVNAFREYFAHLKPDGMIAITRWEFKQPREALRVVSVAMEALRSFGVRDASRHFMVIAERPLNVDGVPVLVLAKKSPFTADEEAAARAHVAEYDPMTALYMPSDPRPGPFRDLIASGDAYAFGRAYPFNVAPVTDDAPFFFFTSRLGEVARGMIVRGGIDYKVNAGLAVLLMLFVISLLAVAALLVVPLLFVARGAGATRARKLPLVYFILIGLAYILVEIALIQRFVLFLGHPTYALTVVVFVMLLASGAGSAGSRRLLPDPLRVRVPIAIAVLLLAVYVAVLAPVLAALVGWPLAARVAFSALLLAPLGFVMGMPFPSGLRALAGAGEQTIEWAWALNAGASVLGSVLAMVLAVQFGLHTTLGCGAAAYASALGALAAFRRLPAPVTHY